MNDKKVNIEISIDSYTDLKTIADGSGFENVDEFVQFILGEVINNTKRKEKQITDKEKTEIDKGLTELGYKD